MKEKKEQLKLIYVAPSVTIVRVEASSMIAATGTGGTPEPGGGLSKEDDFLDWNDGEQNNKPYNLWNDDEEK
ncbi:MAG: hypothetical protein IJ548_04925 [Paludibacteraceae bacterium]|nr:hypothetical protein [Paludibacteraceae bacterium]